MLYTILYYTILYYTVSTFTGVAEGGGLAAAAARAGCRGGPAAFIS